MSWDNIFAFAKDNSEDIITRRLESDNASDWYALADAAMAMSHAFAVTFAGGEMQRYEAERMKPFKWPRVCLKHPDSRKPSVHESFGAITVYDLDTVKQDRFDLEIGQIKLLCDEEGTLLPYDQMVAVLKRVFNDFEDGGELDGFVAELMEKHDDAAWIEHFEEFIRCQYPSTEVDKMWGFELEEDHWWPLLKNDEIDPNKHDVYINTDHNDNEHALAFKFNIGPVTMEAVYLDAELAEGHDFLTPKGRLDVQPPGSSTTATATSARCAGCAPVA